MYSLFGLEKNIETLLLLGSLDGNFPQNTEDLKRNYKSYLMSIQPEETVSDSKMKTEFVWNLEKSKKLIELFGVASTLNDMDQENVISKNFQDQSALVRTQTMQALGKLRELDPQLHHLFEITIEKIFFAGSKVAGGGSSSSALGCIWLNPRAHWTEQDYLEFFVHELTHNLIFLDERRVVHYGDFAEIEKSENYAYSAILKRARPLDKVVHSLFVVYEVLSFRLRHFNAANKTFLHPNTGSLFEGAFETLQSLKKVKPQLLSEHLKSMISELEMKIRRMKRNCYENQNFSNR